MKRFRILEYEFGVFSKKCVFRILRAETLKKFKKKTYFVPYVMNLCFITRNKTDLPDI
jgi:hypothetical protein